MRAIVMRERGGPEVLRLEDVPTPVPAPGDVLVRVRAATVNHTDLFHRSGRFFIQKTLPHILGMDVAGEVAALGDGVADWSEGDRVVATFEALGRARDGAYAEYATVPADQLRRIPDRLDDVAAASVGLAFTTAWTALFETGGLRDDGSERVVVTAAASGVGSAALQIARWAGAEVVAVGDAGKAEAMRRLGADAIVDRRAADLVAAIVAALRGGPATLVLDLVGGAGLQASIDVLGERGRVVCAGTLAGDRAEIDAMSLIMKRASLRGAFNVIARAEFERILGLFASGAFAPVIDRVLPLADARAAHERIEAQQATGKIVLVP